MTTTNNGHLKLARTYLDQAKRDFGEAKTALRQNKLEKSALLFNQAANNALTSLLVSRNRLQNPTFNLTELLQNCISLDKELESLRDACQIMDSIQEKSLFRMHKRKNEMIEAHHVKEYRQEAEKVLDACAKSAKRNRFFEA